MLLSPLLLVAIDRLLMPRFMAGHARVLEELSEPQDAPIIIAGFGRYGQIIGRLLPRRALRQPCWTTTPT
jgi:glutathione-regulated potassium-efflux system ancillary protein KefC